MSQNVKVYRTLEFYNKGGATRMSTIDSDDSATILQWRPETADTGYLAIGDGTKDMDVKVFLGSTTEYVLFDVGNSRVDYGENSQGVDIRIFGDTASSLLLWDTSDDRLEFDGCDLNLQDSDILQFGDAQDVAITWDASNLTIIPATDNTGAVQIGNDGSKSMDLKLFGATASAYMEWDNSADRLNLVGVSGRAITGEEHQLDLIYGGTLSSGDSMVGVNVAVTPSGTAAAWVCGVFAKVTQGATKTTDGYITAGEYEINNSTTDWSAAACLTLNWNNSGNQGSSQAYVTLRDYGSTKQRCLLEFTDAVIGTNSATALVSSTAAKTHSHSIRFTMANTPYWIMVTSTAPAA